MASIRWSTIGHRNNNNSNSSNRHKRPVSVMRMRSCRRIIMPMRTRFVHTRCARAYIRHPLQPSTLPPLTHHGLANANAAANASGGPPGLMPATQHTDATSAQHLGLGTAIAASVCVTCGSAFMCVQIYPTDAANTSAHHAQQAAHLNSNTWNTHVYGTAPNQQHLFNIVNSVTNEVSS